MSAEFYDFVFGMVGGWGVVEGRAGSPWKGSYV